MTVETFQLDRALERVEGDKIFLFGLIEEFLSTVDQEKVVMREALLVNDRCTIKNTLHKLKGTLGNLGAFEAYKFISEIENNISDNSDSNLEEIISQVILKIEKFKGVYQSLRN